MAHNPITPGITKSIVATSPSGNTSFPTGTFNQVMVTNAGANIAFFAFGADSTVAAGAAQDTPILAGEVITVTPPGNAAFVAAISVAGATVYFTFGNGI